MGVAVRVSTSTVALSFLIFSLWATPKRCSSSTMSSPSRLKWMSLESSRCVPTTRSMAPPASPATISRCSLAVRNRLRQAISTGKPANRSRKVAACCSASTVVGTSTATCQPSSITLKAPRAATSVLP